MFLLVLLSYLFADWNLLFVFFFVFFSLSYFLVLFDGDKVFMHLTDFAYTLV